MQKLDGQLITVLGGGGPSCAKTAGAASTTAAAPAPSVPSDWRRVMPD